jgi:hypothetical protein
MIFKIDKKEKDAFEKAAAQFSLDIKFFTMESNPVTVQVEILDGSREISLLTAYSIGRLTAMEKLSNSILK